MSKSIDPVELTFLLRFPVMPNVVSPVDFLSNWSWGGIKALSNMDQFRNLDKDIEVWAIHINHCLHSLSNECISSGLGQTLEKVHGQWVSRKGEVSWRVEKQDLSTEAVYDESAATWSYDLRYHVSIPLLVPSVWKICHFSYLWKFIYLCLDCRI